MLRREDRLYICFRIISGVHWTVAVSCTQKPKSKPVPIIGWIKFWCMNRGTKSLRPFGLGSKILAVGGTQKLVSRPVCIINCIKFWYESGHQVGSLRWGWQLMALKNQVSKSVPIIGCIKRIGGPSRIASYFRGRGNDLSSQWRGWTYIIRFCGDTPVADTPSKFGTSFSTSPTNTSYNGIQSHISLKKTLASGRLLPTVAFRYQLNDICPHHRLPLSVLLNRSPPSAAVNKSYLIFRPSLTPPCISSGSTHCPSRMEISRLIASIPWKRKRVTEPEDPQLQPYKRRRLDIGADYTYPFSDIPEVPSPCFPSLSPRKNLILTGGPLLVNVSHRLKVVLWTIYGWGCLRGGIR